MEAHQPAKGREPALLTAAWRNKWLVLFVGILTAAAVYGLSYLQPTRYEAGAGLLLNDPRTSGVFEDASSLVLDPGRYVRNQARILESSQVAARASEILDGTPSASEVEESVSASPANDLDEVTVRGVQPTAAGAVALVDAVVQAYEELVSGQVQTAADDAIATLEASKNALQQRVAELDAALVAAPEDAALTAERNSAASQLVTIDTRIGQISVNAALYGSGVQLYIPPKTPGSPVQPRPLRNAAVAGVLGIIAGVGLAWWREERNQKAEDRQDPAAILDAPLLGSVPAYWEVNAEGPAPTVTTPESPASEAYHFVVSSLGFALSEVNGKTVMITSAGPNEGKTVTALNLAIAALGDGRTPLLVDVDDRVRGLTRLSGFAISRGVTDVGMGIKPAEMVRKWAVEGDVIVEVVPAGTKLNGGTAGFFRSPQFRTAVTGLSSHHDLVIFDAPPVLAAAETSDIASNVDGVVVVVRRDTLIRDLEDTKARLAIAGTPILGYVFNWAKGADGRYGYGYGYGGRKRTEP